MILVEFSGAEAATITHCSAASITVSIAAMMTGTSPDRIAALPDVTGMADCVVIPVGHCVNYGQPINQAIRLAGATPILAGTKTNCTLLDIEQQLTNNDACCLLLVSSKLTSGNQINLSEAVKLAKDHGVTSIIDGAAQDFRIKELLDTGADLVLVSRQKYLASPTAGLIFGKREYVDAVRAQDKGIGRGMKATKEAIVGVMAAIEERSQCDLAMWQKQQAVKVEKFTLQADTFLGVSTHIEPDPTDLPFSRVYLEIDRDIAQRDASTLVAELKSGTPSIWVIEDKLDQNRIGFELVQCADAEIATILNSLSKLVSRKL
jgi:uncharacterized pyridoxal phosphate-dependent enzyme